MRKPLRVPATAVSLLFLTGCFSIALTPLPTSPAERVGLDVRGVVVGDDVESGEHIRFDEIIELAWTNEGLHLIGSRKDENGALEVTNRTYPYTSLAAVLVRRLDAGKTSGIIGGVIVGGVMVIALLVTGSHRGPVG